MTKISPIGAFCIALFVTHWNKSADTEYKQLIRFKILSANAIGVTDGIEELESMTNKDLQWQKAALAMLHPDFRNKFIGLLAILFTSSPKSPKEVRMLYRNTQDEVDKAKSDIAFYFATMFKEGHFEELPLPDFFQAPKKIIVERRTLSPDGKMSVAGPK